MKNLVLPSFCALLLAGCNPADRQATAGTGSAPTQPNSNGPAPTAPQPVVVASNPPAPAIATASNQPVAIQAPTSPAAAVLAAPKPPPELPAPAQEAVRLAQSTVDQTVVVNFIESIQQPFSLNADQIIYLADLGLGTPVINALLKKANNPLMMAGPVQQVTILNPLPQSNSAIAANLAAPEATPAATNVLLTNYLASTVGGAPAGIPGAPLPASPAPIYGQPQPGYSPAPAPAPQPAAQQVVVTQPVTYNVFYESLSPYGNWVMVEPYGWCWQPSVVTLTPAWRPYCDGGQWLWTDHGWYWQSSYSWGWAPFHYGRWHRSSSIGWVWSPGTDWGPAWVSWRYNDAHCGWAPLPPECHWSAGVGFSWYSRGSRVSIGFGIWDDCWYATSWNRFCDPGLPRWCVDRREIPRFVHNSRHAVGGDHSVNIVGNNNTVIINNGIPADEVQRRGRQEVRKYGIADAPSPDRAAQRINANSSSPRPEVAAFRPRVQADPGGNAAPPPSILARQESRKGNPSPSSASSGFVPSRPGGDSANPVPPVLGAAAPGRSPSPVSAPSRPDAGLPSRNGGKAGEPSGRPSSTAGLTPTPAAPSLPTARPSGGFPQTAPQATPSLPGRGTPSIRADLSTPQPTAPANTPARPTPAPAPSRGTPTPAPANPAVRPADNTFARPTYANPSYSSPAARPTPSPSTQPAGQFQNTPVRQGPTITPAVRQDPAALQQAPSIRSEFRKPEPVMRQSPAPSVGSSFNSSPSIATGGGYSAPSSSPEGGYSGPSRSLPSYSPQPAQRYSQPAPAPAPAPSFRPDPRPAPSAPAPSYSAPARSYPAAPSQGGGARPMPSRGSSPND